MWRYLAFRSFDERVHSIKCIVEAFGGCRCLAGRVLSVFRLLLSAATWGYGSERVEKGSVAGRTVPILGDVGVEERFVWSPGTQAAGEDESTARLQGVDRHFRTIRIVGSVKSQGLQHGRPEPAEDLLKEAVVAR